MIPLRDPMEWFKTRPSLSAHLDQLGIALKELRRRHPARFAFWGYDFAWELSQAGLPEEAARLLTGVVEAEPMIRFVCNSELVGLHSPGQPNPSAEYSNSSALLTSTPRSGNTFLRQLIVGLGLTEYALHHLSDQHWAGATEPFVVQHHVGPTLEALDFADQYSATIIALVRHPIDVLCSIRVFAQRTPACRYWLNGESGLGDVDLASDTGFAAWATSEAASQLLAISTDWSRLGRAQIFRYEDLAADPAESLDRLQQLLVVGSPVHDEASVLDRAAAAVPTSHRTFSGPGAWRSLPTSMLDELADCHRPHLDYLGYGVERESVSGEFDPGHLR